ncbi:OsmC family protein [Methylobacterium sp. ID0610]|uniref:OsmC family protein n=1 Tax=Methylobacterium carpenticola TaxID=3344827 RepID=UPI00368A9F49
MATFTAAVTWALREGDDFASGRYSRGHDLRFDGGVTVPGSASPHVVGAWAVQEAVDPEEMLVAALSSCHMLVFLHLARLAGFRAAAYRDEAEGVMETIAPGRQAVTRVTLRPRIDWTGPAPDAERLAQLHHEAHEGCFIANSVRTEVVVA